MEYTKGMGCKEKSQRDQIVSEKRMSGQKWTQRFSIIAIHKSSSGKGSWVVKSSGQSDVRLAI